MKKSKRLWVQVMMFIAVISGIAGCKSTPVPSSRNVDLSTEAVKHLSNRTAAMLTRAVNEGYNFTDYTSIKDLTFGVAIVHDGSLPKEMIEDLTFYFPLYEHNMYVFEKYQGDKAQTPEEDTQNTYKRDTLGYLAKDLLAVVEDQKHEWKMGPRPNLLVMLTHNTPRKRVEIRIRPVHMMESSVTHVAELLNYHLFGPEDVPEQLKGYIRYNDLENCSDSEGRYALREVNRVLDDKAIDKARDLCEYHMPGTKLKPNGNRYACTAASTGYYYELTPFHYLGINEKGQCDLLPDFKMTLIKGQFHDPFYR